MNLEPRIKVTLHAIDRLHQMRQAFQRIELALHRHEHGIGCAKRIERQQSQRRRAINQHMIVGQGDSGERIGKTIFAPFEIDEFKFGAGKLDRGGNDG